MEKTKEQHQEPNFLESATDLDLLEIIRSKESFSKEEVNSAFQIFYNRYGNYLLNSIRIVCRGISNYNEVVDVIFNNTIFYVYSYNKEFIIEEKSNLELVQQKIKGWLFTIAKYELREIYSTNKGIPLDAIDTETNAFILPETADNSSSFNEKLVEEALASLNNERSSTLLRIYYLHYEEGKNIPIPVREELLKTYGITDDNFRQIISRSKKRVKEYLETRIKTR